MILLLTVLIRLTFMGYLATDYLLLSDAKV